MERYTKRKTQLMKTFEKSLHRARSVFIAHYGETPTRDIVIDALHEYETLIPQIPYIGDTNPLRVFLLPTIRCLAIYKAVQQHGHALESAGQLIYDMARIEFAAIPKVLRKVMGYVWFSSLFQRRIQRRAMISQQREYPGDFVFSYIDGTQQTFDFGIDYVECANCKFLDAQNARELAPYICETDRIASDMLGWGLIRTHTIADGHDTCDFRFTKGGKTMILGSSIHVNTQGPIWYHG